MSYLSNSPGKEVESMIRAFGSYLYQMKRQVLVQKYNKSPKPTLESVAALRGSVSGSAAWLKRYVVQKINE